MAKPPKNTRPPVHDWYLKEWLAALGVTKFPQTYLAKGLDWSKAKGHDVWSGKRPYDRDLLNEVAAFLMIQPYELLIPPEQANKIRQVTKALTAVASDLPLPDFNETKEDAASPRKTA